MNKKTLTNSSITFLADPHLLFLGISFWVICAIVSGVLSLLLYVGYISAYSDSDRISSSKIFFLLFLLVNFVSICALPKWLVVVSINDRGIIFKPIFKKSVLKGFSDYGYIYLASYCHFGFKIKYIVFSQIKLTDYQLTHINQISISDKIIKFRIRNGIKNKLEVVLPKQYIKQLKKQGLDQSEE